MERIEEKERNKHEYDISKYNHLCLDDDLNNRDDIKS
jgi:hypothetical protein